jgi:hypothetical protein
MTGHIVRVALVAFEVQQKIVNEDLLVSAKKKSATNDDSI